MEDKELSPQESLDLIQQMIGKARKRYTDNSFYFLLWGWITIVASLFHYVSATYSSFEYPFAGWSLTIVGAILSMMKGSKDGRAAKVHNYTDKMYGWLWLSLGVAMFTIIFNGEIIDWSVVPFILLLAGVGTSVSGAMMNFQPLRIGAIIFWLLALAAFRVDENQQMLMMAAGVAFGYLVPGYIMKSNAKKHGI